MKNIKNAGKYLTHGDAYGDAYADLTNALEQQDIVLLAVMLRRFGSVRR